MIQEIKLDVPGDPKLPPPDVLVGLGIFLGIVIATVIVAAAVPPRPRRKSVIFLPSYPVFRHCMCGYPARNFGDLASHFEEHHPTAAPEVREDVLFPQSIEGSE
jgi:hypothetical protein